MFLKRIGEFGLDFFKTKKTKISDASSFAIRVCEERIDEAKKTKESISVNVLVSDLGYPKVWEKFRDEVVLKVKDHFKDNGLFIYYRQSHPSRFTLSWDKKYPWQKGPVFLSQIARKKREAKNDNQ